MSILLSLAAGALAGGSTDPVSGTVKENNAIPSPFEGQPVSLQDFRGGAGGGGGMGSGGGGAAGPSAGTAQAAGNALASLLGGEDGNVSIGGVDANLGMLVQGISMGIQGNLQIEQSAQTLQDGRATAENIRQAATLQKLQDNRSRRAMAAKAKAASVASNTSAQIGGVANVVATEEGLAKYFEDYRFYSQEYKARVVMAQAQNAARQQAFAGGMNAIIGTVLTLGAFA